MQEEQATGTSAPGLAWDGAAPRSLAFGDIYFSDEGLAETRHVFLEGNDLTARFAAARRFTIGEFGFGTGLNFLATLDLWRRTNKPDGARLDFISVEGFPLALADFERAHRAWPSLAAYAEQLRALLPAPIPGAHSLAIAPDVALTLVYGEAGAALASMGASVDAWFFDGFSPAKNPQMWRAGLFAEAARLSAPGATFATYTVAGAVRAALAGAGFACEKRAGYGRKKEMLRGRSDAPKRRSVRRPWFESAESKPLAAGARLAIIGGGVAGASLAHEARRQGLDPTIIEEKGLAAGASGNVAGLIMPRVDLGGGAGARFFLHAYLHTLRLLRALPAAPSSADRRTAEPFFNPCGVTFRAADAEACARLRRIAEAAVLPEPFLLREGDGLFLPDAGVVDPPAFIAALAGDTPVVRAAARRIRRAEAGLVVETEAGALGGFDAVILANGFEALRFVEARGLPLSRVAGQIDWFPNATAPTRALAFGPYAAPAPGGGLVVGATYDRLAERERAAPCRAATAANIAALARLYPDLAAGLDPAASSPRASVRCQTPDRFPVAGPLPDLGFYGAEYDALRTGERKDFPPGLMIEGVHILSGLGSRGLVTAPYAAALLIAELVGAPIDHEIAQALHPARFFIRDLKRAKTIRKP